MEIIAELEGERRGGYGGCIGYFDMSGNCDSALAIRTIWMKPGIAYVQAAGGVVYDSTPVEEFLRIRQQGPRHDVVHRASGRAAGRRAVGYSLGLTLTENPQIIRMDMASLGMSEINKPRCKASSSSPTANHHA